MTVETMAAPAADASGSGCAEGRDAGAIVPERTVFVLLSFEGPDAYSQTGGLGVRVAGLARELASRGFPVHLFFIGDPSLPGTEVRGNLHLHRWGQWLDSRYIGGSYAGGVYADELEKVAGMERWLPPHVAESVALPALAQGRRVVVLAEEWQTSATIIALADLLRGIAGRDRVVLLWNANHRIGFERIDLKRLRSVATLTTVSRFMRHVLADWGIEPLVIPNGIGPEWLKSGGDEADVERLRRNGARPLLVKVGRFDADKRWLAALEAVARLKRAGLRPVLVMRGGAGDHGPEVFARARGLGLRASDVTLDGHPGAAECLAALTRALQADPTADLVHLRFFLPQPFLAVLYRAADAVLANSAFEPFGLVGLEVMASGGVAIVGSTGEDYARDFDNCLVAGSGEAAEVAALVRHLYTRPELSRQLRAAGRRTAESYRWERVAGELLARIALLVGGSTGGA